MSARDPVGTMWGLVLGSWGLAGACVGAAVGMTLQVTQGMSGAAGSAGAAGMAVGAVLGVIGLLAERSRAAGRPGLVDGRGRAARPLHGAVLGLPIALALPAVLWLIVIGTVALRSLVPAVTFGMVALGLAWAARRVWSNHRLARALEALEAGDLPTAQGALRGLAEHGITTRRARSTARLNLAMLALQVGDGAGALDWVGGLPGAWPAVVRAQGHLLDGSTGAAEAALAEALSAPGARAVQGQADAVRVLVVWRMDGAASARELAERLHGEGATPLHCALLGALRRQAGDAAGAEALAGSEVRAVVQSALGQSIPELRSATADPTGSARRP